MTRLAAALFALAVLSTAAPLNAAGAATSAQPRLERVIVRGHPSARPATTDRYAEFGCHVWRHFPFFGLEVLELDPGHDVPSTLQRLRASGLVAYAEADYAGSALLTPNDPLYVAGSQWGLRNTGASGGVAGADIKAAAAWDVVHDAPAIVVAVVDSGIRYTHEDLAANLWTNPGETGLDSLGRDKRTNGVDDDGDGYVDDVYGINVLTHTGDPNDDWGHGTHVAGIVGAVGNNGAGISGVAWRVKLMACKFIDSTGNYNVSDAIAALDYARAKGARIITASWGKSTFDSTALRDAIVALRDANIIVAAAAGNDGTNNDVAPIFPAGYSYTNLITAAATDRTDALASFSNYGLHSVHLGAPGANVLSCWNGSNSDYREVSGTSFAAAHVAGACALLWARFPSDSHQQIINRILNSVDPLPSLAWKTVTGGRLNLAAAVAAPTVPTISSATTASATVGTAFTYQIIATESPTTYAATNLAGTGLSLNSTTGVISGSPVAAGTITSQLTASNSAGTSAAVTLTISVSAAAGDTTPPTIASFLFDAATVTGTSGTFVATFNEPVAGVDASDFVMGGQGDAVTTITSVTAVSSTVYRVNFNYTGTSGSVQMAIKTTGTGIADTSGNAFVGGGSAASDVIPFLVAPPADTTPPTAASFNAGTPSGSAVSFTLTFSEPVTGVNATDFIVVASSTLTATLGTITADATNTVYTIPVTFSGSGSLQLMVIGGATANIRDAATNWFAGGSGQLSATATIGGGGSVPAITSATTASATVGTAFSYQITATNTPTSYAATNLSGTGLSLNTTTGAIAGTPTAAGTITSQLTAANATGTSAAVTLTISVTGPAGDTTPPTIASFLFDLGTVTGTSGTFVATFNEPVAGVDASDFVMSGQGNAVTTITSVTAVSSTVYRVNFDYTGTSGSVQMAIKTSGTGIADTAGNAFVGGGFAASDVVPFVVAPPADTTPPTAASFTAGTPSGSAVSFTLTFNEAVTGVNATDFVVVASPTLTATIGTVTADATNTVYTIPVTFSGSGSLQLMVIGGATANIRDAATNWFAGGSGQLSATVTIGGGGSIPTISGAASGSATIGTAFSYQITASGSPTSYALASGTLPSGITLNSTSGLVSGTAATGTAGSYPVSFTATNSTGTSAAFPFTLTVTAAGAAPTITSPTTASAIAGTAFSYQITATGSPTSYAASGLPTGLTVSTSSGLISGTPSAAGTATVTISATNTTGTGSATLTITVAAAGTPPTIAAQTATGNQNQAFSYQVVATGATSFSIVGTPALPAGLSMSTSGLITGTPAAGGSTAVTIRATNTYGSNEAVVTIAITADMAAPTVSSFTVASNTSSTVNFALNFSEPVTGVTSDDFSVTTSSGTTASVTGVTGTNSSYTVTVSYAGPAAGTVRLTLKSAGTGIADLAGNAYTGGGTPNSGTFTLPSGPVVTSTTVAGITGSSFSYQIQATGNPTSYSSGALPAGLSLNPGTGFITGSPTVAGTSTVMISATNANGTGTGALSFQISQGATNTGGGGGGSVPPPIIVGGGGGGSFTTTIVFAPIGGGVVGQPITLNATSTTGQAVIFTLVSGNATLSGNVLTPKTPGAIVIRATVMGGSTTMDQTITAKNGHTIQFVSPVSLVQINSPIQLSATSSAGLPVTFTLVSGNASISGNVLTPKGPGAIVVRASSAGSDTVAAASTDVNLGNPAKASQNLAIAGVSDTTVTAGPMAVVASSSSGLPVTLSVSGPARLSGNTLTFTGVSGIVTVRAAQAGNDIYAATEVARTFAVRAVGQQVYLGTMGSDTFAIVISQDDRRGMFLTRLSDTGDTIATRFSVESDGSFQTSISPILQVARNGNQPNAQPSAAAFTASRTLRGAVNNGVVTGSLPELDRPFTASVMAPTGPTAALAGLYVASLPGSSSGEAYLVAAPNGTAYALVDAPFAEAAGMGTVTPAGRFEITTAAGPALTGTVDRDTGQLQGELTHAAKSYAVAGLSDGTPRTERLVNLSSRMRISAANAIRNAVAGFVITGDAPKSILVRAVGPGLARFGVGDALANPTLQLYRGSTVVAENDDWSSTTSGPAEQVGAFPLTANSRDAALSATVEPGNYTAVVTGGDGTVLVEVYDADSGASAAPQLANLSTRGYVDADGQLIAGFVVAGNAPKRVLIRGIGPSLSLFNVAGAVADPSLALYPGGATTSIARNDDWSVAQPLNATQLVATSTELAAAATTVGAFALPAGSKDAALLITLQPGTYTAVMGAANRGGGIGLIEVYQFTRP